MSSLNIDANQARSSNFDAAPNFGPATGLALDLALDPDPGLSPDQALDLGPDPALEALFGEDLKAHEKARRMSAGQHRELLAAMRKVMSGAAGQRFLWWLLEQTHVFQTSFTGNSTTFFLEGERNVGLKVFALCAEAEPAFMQELMNFKRAHKSLQDKENTHGRQ